MKKPSASFPCDFAEISKRFPFTAKSRNLVRFGRHSKHEILDDQFQADYAFRDRASRFSILKSHYSLPGPDECFSTRSTDPRPLFKKLLGLEVTYPGVSDRFAAQLMPYNSMNYYRSHIEEFFSHTGEPPYPPMLGRCLMFFPETDRMTIVYEISNNSEGRLPLNLRWFSEGAPGSSSNGRASKNSFSHACAQRVVSDYWAAATVVASDARIRFRRQGLNFSSSNLQLTLAARETCTFTFELTFGFGDKAPSSQHGPQAAPWVSRLRSTVKEVERLYENLPVLPADFARYESLALKATGILNACRFTEELKDGRKVESVHAGKTGICATWFWDTAFSLMGLGLIGARKAGYGAIDILVGGIQEDGSFFARFHDGAFDEEKHQFPILIQGTARFASFLPDHKRLAAYYPALTRYLEAWFRDFDTNGNGVVEYPEWGVGHDDSYRWHDGLPLNFKKNERWDARKWGRRRIQLFENPELNAHLYLECLSLASIARALGREQDAARWTSRGRALGRRAHEELYDKETGIYMDRHIKTGKFTGICTVGSFMPLYAGFTPKPLARRMCEEYLLNTDRFYTTLPFPTVDLQHQIFRPGGFLYEPEGYPGALSQHAYWNGRAWPQFNYWMVAALYRSGLVEEADAAADRILGNYATHESLHECYDPLTGFGNGHPEFLWSAAAALGLVFQLYKQPPVAENLVLT